MADKFDLAPTDKHADTPKERSAADKKADDELKKGLKDPSRRPIRQAIPSRLKRAATPAREESPYGHREIRDFRHRRHMAGTP
jgi:hypothetical protein